VHHPRTRRRSTLPGLLLGALLVAALAPAGAGAHTNDETAQRDDPVVATTASAPSGPASFTGLLQRIHGHRSGRGHRPVAGWMLTTAKGRRVPLTFATGVLPRAGAHVRVRGSRRGAMLRVRSVKRVRGSVRGRSAAVPTGAKRTAVVLFNFRDDRSRPFTDEQVRRALFTGSRSVSAFYAAESRGRLSLTGRDRPDGDVYGWYEIDASGKECFGGEESDWYAEADAAAAAAGQDLRGYEHVVYVHPEVESCGFAGIATLGGGWSSLNGTVDLWVAGHEIGHNYEFDHAGRLYCQDPWRRSVAVGGDCRIGEYDDPYDIMGNRFERHSNGVLQLQAGWIPLSSLRTVTASGTYDLAPLAEGTSSVQVLRIPRGDGRSYWLEFRRPQGHFDDFAPGDPVVNGVTIRVAGGLSRPGVTQLVDTTPETGPAALDESLGAGRSFVDSERRIRVTTEEAGPAGARVSVQLGNGMLGEAGVAAPPPVAAPPSPPAAAGPGDAAADGGDVAPRRFPADRASVGGRRVAGSRLKAADGRALTVRSRRGRAALDLRFGLGAEYAMRAGRLELRLRATACATRISVRDPAGRWTSVGRVSGRHAWANGRIPLAAGAMDARSDVRLTCLGRRGVLRVDSAAVRTN